MLLDIIREHGGLAPIDLLCLSMALNADNRFVVIEALAGCGKTALLASLVERIGDPDGVLLLSFTRAAVSVARLRVRDRHDLQLTAQTFDSLFYHAVRNCLGVRAGPDQEELDFQRYRDLSSLLTPESLETFECRSRARYRLRDVRYIIVDEAQDTPPEALALLRFFRQLGKIVLITGDRHQAIFRFMETESLFERLHASPTLPLRLRVTWRCCQDVVRYVNGRFDVGMQSGLDNKVPTGLRTICVQSRYNATLGRIFARFLFTTRCPVRVHVSEGPSRDTFDEHAVAATRSIYGCDEDRARDAINERMEFVERLRGAPLFVFSTIHHFKGGECDVTILTEDVAVDQRSGDDDELVRYVAATRPRWGLLDLRSLTYHGHPEAAALLSRVLQRRNRLGMTQVASACGSPLVLTSLATQPDLNEWMNLARRLYEARPLLPDVRSNTWVLESLWRWWVQREAHQRGVTEVYVRHAERALRPSVDRTYERLRRQGVFPEVVHLRLETRIRRCKARIWLTQYLVVVARHWPLWHPRVIEAAWLQSRLAGAVQCRSLHPLIRSDNRLPPTTRAGLEDCVRHWAPQEGILAPSRQWAVVVLRQPLNVMTVNLASVVEAIIVEERPLGRECHLLGLGSLAWSSLLRLLCTLHMVDLQEELVVDRCTMVHLASLTSWMLDGECIQRLRGLVRDSDDVVLAWQSSLVCRHDPAYYHKGSESTYETALS